MPTEYNMMMNNKARQTRASPELWKYHNIRSRMNSVGFEYKCGCCHEEEEKWMSEWEAKKHINTKKHQGIHQHYKKSVDMEKKYKDALKKIKGLEKELFQYKGENRLKSFMGECEEQDYIMISEDDEVQLPNGKTITRPITYHVAPTTFDEIYYYFCNWSDDNTFSGEVCKESVKKFMLEYQKNSSFGLDIGEYEEELKKNGTYDKPRFNFTYIETSQ